MARPTLTFHGGVREIGGNKILLEDGDARLWLDMGSPFDFGSEYFVEYLGPRTRFGLRDYFALDLLPKIPGLYAESWLERSGMEHEPPAFSGVFVTHIHFDHTNHLRFVDPEIPVHLGVGTKTILDSWETTARIDFKDHDYRTFRTGETVRADGVDVEPIHVDHSAPAAYGFLLHTSEGALAYTGDLRQHGPHAEMTQDFIDAASRAEPVALLTEGTRVAPKDPRTNFSEAQVKEKSIETVARARGKAAFATFYPRDVDRMRTFIEVAKATGRRFVLQSKAAHLLVSLAGDPRIQLPDVLRDADILVYDRLLDRQDAWEKDLFARLGDRVVTSEDVRAEAGQVVVQLDFTTLPELIDLRPPAGSPFIHSKSEPIEENDEAERTLTAWVRHFRLRRFQYHASGHMSEQEIADMVRTIRPKAVFPIHTEHPERFTRFGPRTILPVRGVPMDLG